MYVKYARILLTINRYIGFLIYYVYTYKYDKYYDKIIL